MTRPNAMADACSTSAGVACLGSPMPRLMGRWAGSGVMPANSCRSRSKG